MPETLYPRGGHVHIAWINPSARSARSGSPRVVAEADEQFGDVLDEGVGPHT